MGSSSTGPSRRRRPVLQIKCMYFHPETGKQDRPNHDPDDPNCRFVHPNDREDWDSAKASYRREREDQHPASDRFDRRGKRPSYSNNYEQRRPDAGYSSRDGHKRRSPSPVRRLFLSDRDLNPPRFPLSKPGSSSSPAKPASPVQSDRANETNSLPRTVSSSGKSNGEASANTSRSLPAPIQTSDLKESTSKQPTSLWLPMKNVSDSPVTYSSTETASAPVQLPSPKSTLDTTSVVRSDLMDIDLPLSSSPLGKNDQQPPPSSISGPDDREATIIHLMKLLMQMSELNSTISQREQEIREIKRLLSHSPITISPHPRIAHLEKDNEEDTARLWMLVSHATVGPNPIRDFAQSPAMSRGTYQSRADLLASVEKLKADVRNLSDQQKASLSKPIEPPSKTTESSKKRKLPEPSPVPSHSASLAVSKKVLRSLGRELSEVREEVEDAKGSVHEWGEILSSDLKERFDKLMTRKNEIKSNQAARTRGVIQEIQDKYEKERAEDRAKVAQFMAESAALNDNHQQLRIKHQDRADHMAKLEDEIQALLHALHAYQQSRSQFNAPALQTRIHALFEEITKSTLDTIRSELEPKLEAVVAQADEAAVKRNKATFASVLANLQPTVQLNQLIQDWIAQADCDSIKQAEGTMTT